MKPLFKRKITYNELKYLSHDKKQLNNVIRFLLIHQNVFSHLQFRKIIFKAVKQQDKKLKFIGETK